MATTRRKKGESPRSYAARKAAGSKKVSADDGRFPGQGVLEAVLTGLAFIPAVAITAVAAEEAEYQRSKRDAERELDRIERERQRLIERLGRNTVREERELGKVQYVTRRLAEINEELRKEGLYSTRRYILNMEKERLEDELFHS
jgi:hypothetical protein